MKPKIAIIGLRGYPSAFPGSSGIDTYLEKLLPHLSKKYEIHLYIRSWSKSFSSVSDIHIHSTFCFNNKYFDTGIYSIIAPIKAIFAKHDIYWFHAPSSCVLLFLFKLFHKKTIVTYHGIDWQRKKWSHPINRNTLRLLESSSVNLATITTVVSLELKKYLSKRYHHSSILTLPGFEPKIVSSQSSQSYILYLGRLVPEKRVDWLIKSFINISSQFRQYKLFISGKIDQKSSYYKKLLSLTNHHSQIVFTDYVDGFKKENLLKNCRLFVLPSELEGYSLSLSEALEYQRLCLVASLPVHRQLSKKFSNIILFKVNSFSDFQKQLNYSLSLPFLPTPLSVPNRTWARQARLFTNIFTNLLCN